MALSGQQWVLKGVNFDGANTGIVAGAFDLVCLHCGFSNGAVGIDASAVSGSLTVIDSAGDNLGTLISSTNGGGSPENSIILENIQNSGNTVTLNGNVALSGSVTDTWVHGNMVSDAGA
jgi:glucan 1,3-beta-glucosidase